MMILYRKKTMRLASVLAMSILAIALQSNPAAALTSQQLWDEYAANPDQHSNIPNCSFAGYKQGDVPPPTVPVVASITDFGGVGDGTTDNTWAFRKAIKAVFARGGGALLIPEGTWLVEKMIRMDRPGVVLRGEGIGKTIIKFPHDLENVSGSTGYGTSKYNWTGGLVWFGPDDAFVNYDDNFWGRAASTWGPYKNSIGHEWEYWKHHTTYATVSGVYSRGDWQIQVDDASSLRPGQKIVLVYKNPSDLSLLREIGAHESMQDWGGFGQWLSDTAITPVWPWAVQIASVSGNTVTLAQPLRVAIKSAFQVKIQDVGKIVEEAGIENLTLELDAPAMIDNNSATGYNGVCFNRAWNCWARDVEVKNGQNGFLLSASKNISMLNTHVTGNRAVHHAYTNRCFAQDNLWDGFTVDLSGDVMGGMHGINTEFLSAGMVWSRGNMQQGTFDSHRAMSFDYIRTDIFVNNSKEANPGGAKASGPYTGRNTVHWNVEIGENAYDDAEKGLYILQPDCHVLGAFVGVRGAALTENYCWNNNGGVMPSGDKSNLIIESGLNGQVPSPANLYDAQMSLRESQNPWLHFTSHFSGMLVEGDKKTTVKVNTGSTNATVVLTANGEQIGTRSGAGELSFDWTPQAGAAYVLQAKMQGRDVETQPLVLTAGGVEKINVDDSRVRYSGNWSNNNVGDEKPKLLDEKGKITTNDGSEVEVTFTGTRIDMVAFLNPTHVSAKIDVYIDGEKLSTNHSIGYRVQGSDYSDFTVWSSGALNPGEHTARFVFTDPSKNFTLDYFRILSGEGSYDLPSDVASRIARAPLRAIPRVTVVGDMLHIRGMKRGVVDILDVRGRVMKSAKIDALSRSQTLSLATLAPGAYIARLRAKAIERAEPFMYMVGK